MLNNSGDVYIARQTRPKDTSVWLSGIFIVSILTFNILNLYSFAKMVEESLRQRREATEHTREHGD